VTKVQSRREQAGTPGGLWARKGKEGEGFANTLQVGSLEHALIASWATQRRM